MPRQALMDCMDNMDDGKLEKRGPFLPNNLKMPTLFRILFQNCHVRAVCLWDSVQAGEGGGFVFVPGNFALVVVVDVAAEKPAGFLFFHQIAGGFVANCEAGFAFCGILVGFGC